ncbi:hypothetical protein [Micromonospora sp. URMC 103]|uniref:hypothetical protein n=1 Tax=Micromonospora sp. URMC 103 TaxID=3423406 RepID=UPI003F1B3369
MPDNRDPASRTDDRSRPTWQRVVAVTGTVVALLVAIGAWLLPEPGSWVCDVTRDRAVGCNDVPNDFLGRWTGAETCHSMAVFTCHQQEYALTLTISRGQTGEAVVTSRSESGGEPLCESSWTLETADDALLELHVERSRYVGAGDDDGTMSGCPGDLDVRLQLTEQRTLGLETRSGSRTIPLMPPGILLFSGVLHQR